jgi:8-oxo-dGTP diphosphatase
MVADMGDAPEDRSRPFVAAGALISDEAGRIMLVRPTYKKGWDIPGGYVEAGETPREACIREVREELSIDIELGTLLVADWAPHPAEGDKLLLVFDGGILRAEDATAIRLPVAELAGYDYLLPADIGDRLPPRLARRFSAAGAARPLGRTSYLEHGRDCDVVNQCPPEG